MCPDENDFDQLPPPPSPEMILETFTKGIEFEPPAPPTNTDNGND